MGRKKTSVIITGEYVDKASGAVLKSAVVMKKVFKSAFGSIKAGFGTVSAVAGKTFKAIARQAKWAVLGVGAISTAIIKMGVDVIEADNLFAVSMGKMSKSAEAWAKQYADALRLNTNDVKAFMGTMNVMLDSMGLSEKAAYDMSKGLVQLTYDMSSFYDSKPAEAFEKLQAGITGEAEPLKRLGILLNETTVKAYAMSHGIGSVTGKLTEQEKILARYGALMKATAKAQGDMERTLESASNRFKAVYASIKETGQAMGRSIVQSETFEKALGSLVAKFESVEKVAGAIDWGGILDKGTAVVVELKNAIVEVATVGLKTMFTSLSDVEAKMLGFGGVSAIALENILETATKVTLKISQLHLGFLGIAKTAGQIKAWSDKQFARERMEFSGVMIPKLEMRQAELLKILGTEMPGAFGAEYQKLSQAEFNKNAAALKEHRAEIEAAKVVMAESRQEMIQLRREYLVAIDRVDEYKNSVAGAEAGTRGFTEALLGFTEKFPELKSAVADLVTFTKSEIAGAKDAGKTSPAVPAVPAAGTKGYMEVNGEIITALPKGFAMINGELVIFEKELNDSAKAVTDNTKAVVDNTRIEKDTGKALAALADSAINAGDGLDSIKSAAFGEFRLGIGESAFSWAGPQGWPSDLGDPFQVWQWNETLKNLTGRSKGMFAGWELPMPQSPTTGAAGGPWAGGVTVNVNINGGMFWDENNVVAVVDEIEQELSRREGLGWNR